MAYLSPALTLVTGAIKKASVPLVRDFNELEHLQNTARGGRPFAQMAYERTADILKEEFAKIKPGYPVIIRADDSLPANGNFFMLSPVDGFDCFAHANASFAISAALVENNVLTAAVVCNPVTDETFFAEKGSGAYKEGFRNHERLRVPGSKYLENALIACSADGALLGSVCEVTKNVVVSGSAALDLAYMAAGKSDAVITLGNAPSSLAAGILLVKEAGGYVFAAGETDVRSENLTKALLSGSIFAAGEPLLKKTAELTAKILAKRSK